jgi:hypothetical protein
LAGNAEEKKSETSKNSTWNPDGYVLDQHGNEVFPIEHLLEVLSDLDGRMERMAREARHVTHRDVERNLSNMRMAIHGLINRLKEDDWEALV